jgi:hypothetical protein
MIDRFEIPTGNGSNHTEWVVSTGFFLDGREKIHTVDDLFYI